MFYTEIWTWKVEVWIFSLVSNMKNYHKTTFRIKKNGVENNLLMYHCTFKCLTKLYNKLSYLVWFLNSLLFIIAKGHVKYLLINGRRVSKVGKEFADFEGWGPSINDVNHLWGRGGLPKGDITSWAYLVKWVTRGRDGSKISKNGWHNLWMAPCMLKYIYIF